MSGEDCIIISSDFTSFKFNKIIVFNSILFLFFNEKNLIFHFLNYNN